MVDKNFYAPVYLSIVDRNPDTPVKIFLHWWEPKPRKKESTSPKDDPKQYTHINKYIMTQFVRNSKQFEEEFIEDIKRVIRDEPKQTRIIELISNELKIKNLMPTTPAEAAAMAGFRKIFQK